MRHQGEHLKQEHANLEGDKLDPSHDISDEEQVLECAQRCHVYTNVHERNPNESLIKVEGANKNLQTVSSTLLARIDD